MLMTSEGLTRLAYADLTDKCSCSLCMKSVIISIISLCIMPKVAAQHHSTLLIIFEKLKLVQDSLDVLFLVEDVICLSVILVH